MLKRTVAVAFIVVIAACGAEDVSDTNELAEVTTSAPAVTTTTAAAPTSTMAPVTTTTETTSVYASLTDDQRRVIDDVCVSASEGQIWETTFFEVATGGSGVQEFEEAFLAVAEYDDGMMLIPSADVRAAAAEAAVPLCTEISWVGPSAVASTSTDTAAMATVNVEIGELHISGDVEGCPPAEIQAGEYWVGPNGDISWTDATGVEWTIDMSVDATSGELLWSFSFTGDSHRLISYHENQSTFEAEVNANSATFNTIFGDSLAGVSGGWPDTAGVITITCV